MEFRPWSVLNATIKFRCRRKNKEKEDARFIFRFLAVSCKISSLYLPSSLAT